MTVEAETRANEELIRSANRTTHAIRALVSFLLLEAVYSLVAAVLIGLGIFPLLTLKEPILSLVVLGVLVAAAGLVHSLLVGFKELAQSKIPSGTAAALGRSQKSGPADEKPQSQYSLGREETIGKNAGTLKVNTSDPNEPYKRAFGGLG